MQQLQFWSFSTLHILGYIKWVNYKDIQSPYIAMK